MFDRGHTRARALVCPCPGQDTGRIARDLRRVGRGKWGGSAGLFLTRAIIALGERWKEIVWCISWLRRNLTT